MANRDRLNIKFDQLVGRGENPSGFTSQGPNGTGHAGNRPGWNKSKPYTGPEVEAEGVWANGNRTAE